MPPEISVVMRRIPSQLCAGVVAFPGRFSGNPEEAPAPPPAILRVALAMSAVPLNVPTRWSAPPIGAAHAV